jgi:hypothetical protein
MSARWQPTHRTGLAAHRYDVDHLVTLLGGADLVASRREVHHIPAPDNLHPDRPQTASHRKDL